MTFKGILSNGSIWAWSMMCSLGYFFEKILTILFCFFQIRVESMNLHLQEAS